MSADQGLITEDQVSSLTALIDDLAARINAHAELDFKSVHGLWVPQAIVTLDDSTTPTLLDKYQHFPGQAPNRTGDYAVKVVVGGHTYILPASTSPLGPDKFARSAWVCTAFKTSGYHDNYSHHANDNGGVGDIYVNPNIQGDDIVVTWQANNHGEIGCTTNTSFITDNWIDLVTVNLGESFTPNMTGSINAGNNGTFTLYSPGDHFRAEFSNGVDQCRIKYTIRAKFETAAGVTYSNSILCRGNDEDGGLFSRPSEHYYTGFMPTIPGSSLLAI